MNLDNAWLHYLQIKNHGKDTSDEDINIMKSQFNITHKKFYSLLMKCRGGICKEWHYGVKALNLDAATINLKHVEEIISGNGGKIKFTPPVKVNKWFEILSTGHFPIYTNIRHIDKISQSEKADMLHDLYGHAPYLISYNFNLICEFFSKTWVASETKYHNDLLKLWFYMIEFGVVRHFDEIYAFGGGLITSNYFLNKFMSRDIPLMNGCIDSILMSNVSETGSPEKLFIFNSVEDIYNSLITGVKYVIEK